MGLPTPLKTLQLVQKAGPADAPTLGARGGGATLKEQGVAAVTHTHWLGIGGQGQLITGTCVAEDVATVSAVVLSPGNGELLFHTAYSVLLHHLSTRCGPSVPYLLP